MEKSLLVYYPFDEINNGMVFDTGKKKIHGTVVDALFSEKGVGKGSLLFDGKRSHVFLGKDEAFSLTGNLTICAWVNFNPDEGRHTLISKHYRGEFDLTFGGGKLSYYHNPWDMGNSHEFPHIFEPNQWYHVALSRKGKSRKINLIVNGRTRGQYTSNVQATPSTYPLVIGYRNITHECAFNGFIDEVMIFDKPLSSSQVKAIYESQKKKLIK